MKKGIAMYKPWAVVATLIILLTHLLSGCATTPTATDADISTVNISLPLSFEKVWYRPTLERPGFFVMADTGTLTVGVDGIDFRGDKDTKYVSYENMQRVSFGKVGSDFMNNWVNIQYRNGQAESYILFSGGKSLGWEGIGTADKMFYSITFALEKKGLNSIVDRK
jgi:hypothetical protein